MPRRQFNETLTLAGGLGPAVGAEVNVIDKSTGSMAHVYTTETGGEAFPASYLVPASGSVVFWADLGEYEVRVSDSQYVRRFLAIVIPFSSV